MKNDILPSSGIVKALGDKFKEGKIKPVHTVGNNSYFQFLKFYINQIGRSESLDEMLDENEIYKKIVKEIEANYDLDIDDYHWAIKKK